MHHSTRRFAVAAALFASLFSSTTAFAGPPPPPPPPEDEPTSPAADDTGDERTQRNAAAAAAAYRSRGISRVRYAAGGLIGTFYGLGIGHAISGEWTSTGWIFTFGELASFGGILVGFAQVLENPDADAGEGALIFGSMGALTILRIVEIYDIWTRPEVAEASRVEQPSDTAFAVGPIGADGGFGALFQLRW